MFPATKELFDRGYSSLTQPEGVAVSRYLRQVREREIGGRPFAVANDQHGPVPTSGAIIFQTEQGSDPAKVERVHDYGRRLEQNMEEVFAKYFTGEGTNVSQAPGPRRRQRARPAAAEVHRAGAARSTRRPPT